MGKFGIAVWAELSHALLWSLSYRAVLSSLNAVHAEKEGAAPTPAVSQTLAFCGYALHLQLWGGGKETTAIYFTTGAIFKVGSTQGSVTLRSMSWL